MPLEQHPPTSTWSGLQVPPQTPTVATEIQEPRRCASLIARAGKHASWPPSQSLPHRTIWASPPDRSRGACFRWHVRQSVLA
jgi:hypothetical protein